MKQKLFINGNWEDAASGATMDVIDPATEEVFHTVSLGGEADIARAVSAAKTAFEAWSRASDEIRSSFLHKMADYIEANADRLASIEVRENGKPMPEAELDVSDTIACFRYYAGLAADLHRSVEHITIPMEGFSSKAIREPVGVVGAIIPWNFPLLLGAWKVAPALAAGCTVVLKPSELTPLSALELGCAAEAAGLPPGVLNVVNGLGGIAGNSLSMHPDVDKITFTGSTLTGTKLMAAVADSVKSVSLELGGKSPMIVFADTTIEEAVEWIMNGVFWNKGEVCTSTSRVLIEAPIYEDVVARLIEESHRIKIGPGTEGGVLLGPLVSQGQYNKVMSAIRQGEHDGARLVYGGARPDGFEVGYFVLPTIFEDVPLESDLWNEEIFGPVVCLRSFESESEAIELANRSDYGLAAAVLSADIPRAERVARLFRAGIVWINCSQPTFVQAPWGGYRRSGIGRELGTWGLDSCLEVKQVTSYDRSEPWGWYISE